jgi:hypothetical protein
MIFQTEEEENNGNERINKNLSKKPLKSDLKVGQFLKPNCLLFSSESSGLFSQNTFLFVKLLEFISKY